MSTKRLKLICSSDGYYRTFWVDDTGKRHSRSFGKNRRVAENRFSQFKALWKIDSTVRTPSNDGPLTIQRAADLYQQHAEVYYRHPDGSPTGEANNMRLALRPVVEMFGSSLVSEFGPKDLKQIQESMTLDDLCVNEINKRVRKIRHVFKWLVSEELAHPSVWHGLQAVEPIKAGRTIAHVTEPVGPVPEVYIDKVLEVLPPTVRAMVNLQLLTGMRPGEVRIMRPIDIKTAGDLWIYRPSRHKNAHRGKSREVLLGSMAQQEIEPFLGRDLEAFLFSPREAVSQRFAQCATHRKRPVEKPKTARRVTDCYTTKTYRRAISHACKKLGIPDWSPNQLRHNFGTRLRKEFGVEAARVALGHSRLDTTELYAEIDADRLREVIRKIG